MTAITQTTLVQQIIYNFQILPPMRKKIFLYIQYLLQKYKRAFPSLEHIAETCGCSLITAKRAIKFFTEIGWITKWRRCYRSSVYQMDEAILKLDLKAKRTFRKQPFTRGNDTIGDTIYSVVNSDKSIPRKEKPQEADKSAESADDVLKKIEGNRKAFAQRVKKFAPSQKIEIDDASLESLIQNFVRGKAEAILIRALEGLESAKKPISNPVGWLFKMCSFWKRRFMM